MFEEKIAEVNAMSMTGQITDADKRVYTVDEIQDILGISRPTAYNLVKKNVFRSIRVGGHIRVSRRSFDEWLDTQMA